MAAVEDVGWQVKWNRLVAGEDLVSVKLVASAGSVLELAVVETKSDGAVVLRCLEFDGPALRIQQSGLSALYAEHLTVQCCCEQNI